MRAAVRLIDSILRKSGCLIEFTDNADCIIRIQLMKASNEVTIGSEKILKVEAV
jgi:ribosomal protein L14